MYGKKTEKSIRRTVRGKKLFSPITNPKSTPHKSIEIDIPYFGCISVDTFEESIEIFSVFRYFFIRIEIHVIHFMSHDIMSMIFKLVLPGIFLSNFDTFFDTFVRQK